MRKHRLPFAAAILLCISLCSCARDPKPLPALAPPSAEPAATAVPLLTLSPTKAASSGIVCTVEEQWINDYTPDPDQPGRNLSTVGIKLIGRDEAGQAVWEYITPFYPWDGVSVQPTALLWNTMERIYLTEMGTIHAIDPKSGEILFSNPDFCGGYGSTFVDPDGTLYTQDTLTDAVLFVMNDQGETLLRLTPEDIPEGYEAPYALFDRGSWLELAFGEKDGQNANAPYCLYFIKESLTLTDDRSQLLDLLE